QRYAADQSVVLPLDPGHIGQEHQFFSLESSGNFAGNQVGVDVITFPVHADPDRGETGRNLPCSRVWISSWFTLTTLPTKPMSTISTLPSSFFISCSIFSKRRRLPSLPESPTARPPCWFR